MGFTSLGLSAPIQKAIAEKGYTEPSPIQAQAIPAVLAGRDVMAAAQTGTGKTAGFTLPILERLSGGNSPRANQARTLILTPTRELAAQIYDNVEMYGKHLPLTSTVVFGGVKINPQMMRLRQGVDVLVATPGRLLDLYNQKAVSFKQLEILVLDEADRMLDMGFLADIEKLTLAVKEKHQTLMFSATYSNKVKSLANQLLTTPKTIGTEKQNSTSGKVKQSVYWVSEARKRELLSELIGVNNWQQVLVFAGTKESANILAKELKLDGIKSALCHGDKSQGSRNKALADFSEGKVRVLVATDVAARGLDIDDLAYVVNFHLPFLAEDYVHRVGRTGRAGKSGRAISLVSPKDERFLENIEELIGRQFERIIVPGYELKQGEALEHQQISEKRASKNRYRANQEKNQAIEKKKQASRSSNKKYNAKIKKKR